MAVLAGCTPAPGPTVTVTATVTPVAPASSLTVSPPASEPVVTPTAPSSPVSPASTDQDVSAWPKADFATPSGRIWCALTADNALCHFPRGYQGTIPPGQQVCPGEGLDVTGVSVTASGPRYFCSGDPSAYPVAGRDEVRWHLGTGYPFVTYDGFSLAVLPYGKSLRDGAYVCSSAETGVTCANGTTTHGFRIALAGVVFF